MSFLPLSSFPVLLFPSPEPFPLPFLHPLFGFGFFQSPRSILVPLVLFCAVSNHSSVRGRWLGLAGTVDDQRFFLSASEVVVRGARHLRFLVLLVSCPSFSFFPCSFWCPRAVS